MLPLLLLWLALCAPLPARAGVLVARGDAVVLRQPAGDLVLQPRILIGARPDGPGEPQAAQPQPVRLLPFSPEGDGLESRATEGGLDLRLRLHWEAGAGFVLQLRATASAPTWVRLIAVEIDVDADGATLLGRDLRPQPLDTGAALGRGDPKWVTLRRRGVPILTIDGSDDLDGLQLRRAAPGRLRLRVDLLATEARPFFHFASCTGYWKDPNQRLTLPARLLLQGEAALGQLHLYPGAALPLVKARFPDGRRAAFVLTDHADQTAAPTLRAIAGGTSDMGDPRWGQGGLLGYGLPVTKALWLRSGDRDPALGSSAGPGAPPGPRGAHGSSGSGGQPGQSGKAGRAPVREAAVALPAPGEPGAALLDELGTGLADESGGGRPQLDDPQVVALADRLHAAGWEIIPHSATPMRDGRELTEKALKYFRRYGGRSWINHQPYTNCEALVNQGYRAGHYGIADLLKSYGYRYAWSGLDQAPGDLNLLAPRRLDQYVPVFWPVGRLAVGMPDDLWLFRSMLSFVETERFFEVYSPEALDRLERERGLHIANTYLENIHPPGSWFGKRNLLVPGPRPREVVLDPRLDAMLAGLSARAARGSLWVPTIARLGDHMGHMARVSVVLDTDGSAVVQAPAAVPGATFVVPQAGLQVLCDGKPPLGSRSGEGETSFWLDLPAGRPVRVRLQDGDGRPVAFLGGRHAVLGSGR